MSEKFNVQNSTKQSSILKPSKLPVPTRVKSKSSVQSNPLSLFQQRATPRSGDRTSFAQPGILKPLAQPPGTVESSAQSSSVSRLFAHHSSSQYLKLDEQINTSKSRAQNSSSCLSAKKPINIETQSRGKLYCWLF